MTNTPSPYSTTGQSPDQLRQDPELLAREIQNYQNAERRQGRNISAANAAQRLLAPVKALADDPEALAHKARQRIAQEAAGGRSLDTVTAVQRVLADESRRGPAKTTVAARPAAPVKIASSSPPLPRVPRVEGAAWAKHGDDQRVRDIAAMLVGTRDAQGEVYTADGAALEAMVRVKRANWPDQAPAAARTTMPAPKLEAGFTAASRRLRAGQLQVKLIDEARSAGRAIDYGALYLEAERQVRAGRLRRARADINHAI